MSPKQRRKVSAGKHYATSKDINLDCHWKSHLLDILHACKHHPQNHIRDSISARLYFLLHFLGFLFLGRFFFLTQGNAHVVYH